MAWALWVATAVCATGACATGARAPDVDLPSGAAGSPTSGPPASGRGAGFGSPPEADSGAADGSAAGAPASEAASGTDGASDDAQASASCDGVQCGHGVCGLGPLGPVCSCDEGFGGDGCDARTVDYGRREKIAEHLADPDVLQLGDDRWVLTGTGSGVDFEFLESTDFRRWHRVGSYDPSTTDPSFDYCYCWAPDLVELDGKPWLYFSAHRGPNGATACPPPSGAEVTTFRAPSLDGSLAFGAPELLFQGQDGAQSRPQAGCPAGGCDRAIRIDPTVHGGRLYYVFFDRGNNVASVSLTDPFDLRVHAGPARWALAGFEEGINEAPEVLEREGRFHLFFSAAWFDSQYATFYVTASSPEELTRDRPVRRLTTPVRRGNGTLAETHGHNSIVVRRGETFNFFHVGVFDPAGRLVRRDVHRQRIAWNADGTAISQNEVLVSWNPLGGNHAYSLDVVLRDGSTLGPCIAVGRIGQSTSTTFKGLCPDAFDRLVHKSEVQAFRLFASAGGPWVPVGETPFDGYSDVVGIAASLP